MEVGLKLKAKWTETITDHVTEGHIYEVTRINEMGNFWIINDKGEECFPISTSFVIVQ